MKHVKRIPAVAVMLTLVLAGVAAVLTGVYLLAGLPVALVVGGTLAVAGGLLADV